MEIWKTGFERKGQKNSRLFSKGTSCIERGHVTVFLLDYKAEGNNLFSVAMAVKSRSDGLNLQQGVDLSETRRKY